MPVFSVSITIYGSNGEVVRELVSLVPAWASPTDFDVLTPTFAAKNGGKAIILAGGKQFFWDGVNDSGQFVSNGSYTVKMQSLDGFGHVVVQTHQIMVLSDALTYELRVYNSSGEMVNSIVVPILNGQNAPSQVAPDTKAFVPKAGNAGGSVTFDLGAGAGTAVWDGRNSQGMTVASGEYTVQLVAVNSGSAVPLASAAVTALNAAASSEIFQDLAVVPNPLAEGQVDKLEIRFKGVQGARVIGRIYNLAGELVVTLVNDRDETKLVLNPKDRALSSGIYVAVLWGQAPWGSTERRIVKFVVLR
jgi:flagellar hook assembly protein FlgD